MAGEMNEREDGANKGVGPFTSEEGAQLYLIVWIHQSATYTDDERRLG